MPSRSAAAVVLAQNRDVLLVMREDFRFWTIPGGGVEPGETDEEAAIREALEETGYVIGLVRKVGEYERPQSSGGATSILFAAAVTGGAPISRGPETIRVGWFPLDRLPGRMHRFTREMIQDATQESDVPIRRVQKMSACEGMLVRGLFWLRDLRNRVRRMRG